jgi:hypothetical protein
MHSEFSQLLHKYGRTEMNQGTEKRNDVAFFPELNQPVSKCILLQTAVHTETQCLSCSAAQQHGTFTVHIVQSATELYLQ